MRKLLLSGMFALAASTSFAQTGGEPEASPPQEPAAPSAPGAISDPEAEATVPATGTAASNAIPVLESTAGGSANLCQELLAFMTESSTDEAAGGVPPAGQQPQTASAELPEEDENQIDDQASVSNGEPPASGEAITPQPPSQTESAQEASGQSGPAVEGPDPNEDAVVDDSGEDAPQTAGLSAPIPDSAAPDVQKEAVLSIADVEELAGANDMAACQRAARELRLSGVPMPAPLLALAALDLQYFQTSGSQQLPAEE